MFELTNKTILISGASSGIGRECARYCSIQGAKLALIGRDTVNMQQTLSSLSGDGHRIYKYDITEYAGISTLIGMIVGDMGRISGYVHSAGIQSTLSFSQHSPQKASDLFAINYHAAIEVTKAVVHKSHISPESASIVFISSIASVVGKAGLVAYAASKGALVAAVRPLAIELAGKKIRVNCISPGIIRTKMVESYLSQLTPTQLIERTKGYLLGLGETSDIASACVFLLAEESRWITGSNIIVDGGFSCQ